jgi:tRNA pseudouridine55 synthase
MLKTDEKLLLDGILLINKPLGISSNKALQKVKHMFGAKKAGHTGSLDPLATGMLPVCFGEATKISQYLLDADKCYTTTGLLGIKTSTADSEGEILSKVEKYSITQSQLEGVLSQYRGNIKQVPSMFSALKHKGTPLYRLARKGIEIERKARDISIAQLNLDEFDGAHFSLTVACSKGTYIRNLVEDIGESLSVGAHVVRLHRLYTSGFQDMPMYSIEELEAMTLMQKLECLIPMDKAVVYLPSVTLLDNEVVAIRQGKEVIKKMEIGHTQCVRLYDEKSQFIGLGEYILNGVLKAKRLVSFSF